MRPESEIILRGYEDRISFTRGCSSLGLPSFPAWLGTGLPCLALLWPLPARQGSVSTSQILLPTVYPRLAAGLSAAQTYPRNNVCLCPEFLPSGEPQGIGASCFHPLPFVFISYLALGQCFLLFWFGLVFCGVLFCFRLGLIVEASDHSAKTVLAASFLARDFMGAQGKNGSRSFIWSSTDQARRAPQTLLLRCSVPQDLNSSSAFALETINYLPVTIPIDRAGISASSPLLPLPLPYS